MDFVLVHGGFHGAWCWDLVAPMLEGKGHTVSAVDMPISDPDAGAGEYAEAVVAAIEELDAPIVVGHSMGGLVVPVVATSRPVRQMVFLAAPLPKPGMSLQTQREKEPIDPEVDFETSEFTHQGRGVFTIGPNTATEMFFSDVSDDIAAWAIERLRPQSYKFMSEITPLTAWPEVESAYILCRDDHGVNPAWGRTAAKERLGVDPYELDGGHSPFFTRPAELADLLHHIASQQPP